MRGQVRQNKGRTLNKDSLLDLHQETFDLMTQTHVTEFSRKINK